MSHTNETTHYQLAQFLSNDKPTWLSDINPTLNTIDTAIYDAQHTADTASADASNALDAINANDTNLAPLYSSEITYPMGSCVMYNHKLYMCISTISIPEPFTSSHWRLVNLTDDTGVINTNIENQIKNKTFDDLKTPSKKIINAINESNNVYVSGEHYTLNWCSLMVNIGANGSSAEAFMFLPKMIPQNLNVSFTYSSVTYIRVDGTTIPASNITITEAKNEGGNMSNYVGLKITISSPSASNAFKTGSLTISGLTINFT